MKLGVRERLILNGVLPQQGSFTTIKIVRELSEALSFSEEEHALLKFDKEKEKEGRSEWSPEGAAAIGEKDIKIGEKATDIIVDAFTALDRQGQLHVEQFELYETFVGGK